MSRRSKSPAPEIAAIVGGASVLVVTTGMARREQMHPTEHNVFRRLNGLPSFLHPPVYVVMQAGSLAAVFVAAAVAYRFADRRTAIAVFSAGFGTWLGAKGVKRFVQRGRPEAHFEDVVIRGATERGLGFPSGHSGVSFAMATAVAGSLPWPWSALVWLVPPKVGFGRMYVGAHLPLDIVGGAGLGEAIGATVRLIVRQIPTKPG
jgi:undecaprenyl-diphosphatase